MNLSNHCRVVISLCTCFPGYFSKIAGAAVALGVVGGFLPDYKCVALFMYLGIIHALLCVYAGL